MTYGEYAGKWGVTYGGICGASRKDALLLSPTCAAFDLARSSFASACTAFSIAMRGCGVARASGVAARRKQGHGVYTSPIRFKSPESTNGFVVNFSHMNASSADCFSASLAPLRPPTISNWRAAAAASPRRVRTSTRAIRCEPDPIRLTAYRPLFSWRSSMLSSVERAPTCTPQQSGVLT